MGRAAGLASAVRFLPPSHCGSSEQSPQPGESKASVGALADVAHLVGASSPILKGCGWDPRLGSL